MDGDKKNLAHISENETLAEQLWIELWKEEVSFQVQGEIHQTDGTRNPDLNNRSIGTGSGVTGTSGGYFKVQFSRIFEDRSSAMQQPRWIQMPQAVYEGAFPVQLLDERFMDLTDSDIRPKGK